MGHGNSSSCLQHKWYPVPRDAPSADTGIWKSLNPFLAAVLSIEIIGPSSNWYQLCFPAIKFGGPKACSSKSLYLFMVSLPTWCSQGWYPFWLILRFPPSFFDSNFLLEKLSCLATQWRISNSTGSMLLLCQALWMQFLKISFEEFLKIRRYQISFSFGKPFQQRNHWFEADFFYFLILLPSVLTAIDEILIFKQKKIIVVTLYFVSNTTSTALQFFSTNPSLESLSIDIAVVEIFLFSEGDSRTVPHHQHNHWRVL